MMSNDDSEALCPKCGHTIKVASMQDKGRIYQHSLYCSNPECNWEQNWNLTNGLFLKEKPKDVFADHILSVINKLLKDNKGNRESLNELKEDVLRNRGRHKDDANNRRTSETT